MTRPVLSYTESVMSAPMTRDAPVRRHVTFSDRVAGRPVSLQSRRAGSRLGPARPDPVPHSDQFISAADVPGCRYAGRVELAARRVGWESCGSCGGSAAGLRCAVLCGCLFVYWC